MTDLELNQRLADAEDRIQKLRRLLEAERELKRLEVRAFLNACPDVLGEIMSVVCAEFSITSYAVTSRSRKQPIVWPRMVFSYFARELTAQSTPAIACVLGQDHSAVIYAADRVRERMATDLEFKSRIESIGDKLREALKIVEFRPPPASAEWNQPWPDNKNRG